ncbi:hypothetical protein MMC10_001386 [Thelotrema lepadinum]|nr:hypothetical protein [Thelotrema lepadinum]
MSLRSSSPPPPPNTRKRTHDQTFSELEVNLQAPEPPSKKALRRAKKGKDPSKSLPHPPLILDDDNDDDDTSPRPETQETNPGSSASPPPTTAPAPINTKQRSQYGIWIGNLSFTTSKEDLSSFFTTKASILPEEITRVHLPKPSRSSQQSPQPPVNKPQNKGFAYVDFSTPAAQKAALGLSETLLRGRKVLCKDAKSFEGRPPKESKNEVADATGTRNKPPNKRIFVGNLDFDTTEDDLRRLFNRCGEITDVFMATFEDSGKCKGFSLVTFKEIEEAATAVRGWIDLPQDDEEDTDGGEDEDVKGRKRKRPNKPRKWWVNRLKGRNLRMEFADDPSTRYKKRFRKDRDEERGDQSGDGAIDHEETAEAIPARAQPRVIHEKSANGMEPRTEFRTDRAPKQTSYKQVDRRSIRPSVAWAAPQSYRGAIREFQGKKITLE